MWVALALPALVAAFTHEAVTTGVLWARSGGVGPLPLLEGAMLRGTVLAVLLATTSYARRWGLALGRLLGAGFSLYFALFFWRIARGIADFPVSFVAGLVGLGIPDWLDDLGDVVFMGALYAVVVAVAWLVARESLPSAQRGEEVDVVGLMSAMFGRAARD